MISFLSVIVCRNTSAREKLVYMFVLLNSSLVSDRLCIPWDDTPTSGAVQYQLAYLISFCLRMATKCFWSWTDSCMTQIWVLLWDILISDVWFNDGTSHNCCLCHRTIRISTTSYHRIRLKTFYYFESKPDVYSLTKLGSIWPFLLHTSLHWKLILVLSCCQLSSNEVFCQKLLEQCRNLPGSWPTVQKHFMERRVLRSKLISVSACFRDEI